MGKPGDDDYFPLSKSIITSYEKHKTLQLKFAENINPPINTIWKTYYANTNQNILFSTGNGQSERAPRHFINEDITKTFTGNDADYSMGYRKVVLNGFSKCDAYGVNCGNRPNLEKAVFDPMGGNAPRYNTELPTSNETDSREFLQLAASSYLLWAGCPQVYNRDTAGFCCNKGASWNVWNYLTSNQKLDFDQLHHRVTCPQNDSVHTIVSNFDLNRVTPDGQSFVHIFSIRPDNGGPRSQFESQTRPKIVEHFPQLRDSWSLPPGGLFSDLEAGVIIPCAALSGSLWMDKRHKIIWRRHDFLSASSIYGDQVTMLSDSLPAPALPNPSQMYNFAKGYRRLLEENRWPFPALTDNPTPKSAADPGQYQPLFSAFVFFCLLFVAVCHSVYLSISLSFYLFICQSFYLFCLYLAFFLPISLSFCPSLSLSLSF